MCIRDRPITSGADNRVITASSASAIQGESSLTYDALELHVNNASPKLKLTDTDNSGVVHLKNVGGVGILTTTDATIFETAGTERLRITSAGRLGVGDNSPTTKLHVRNGTLMIKTDTNFHTGSGENGENYPTIFFNGDHSSGNNPAHGKITVRHSSQNPYSGDILLMPQGHYGGSYGYQEVLRVSAYKRVGINESSPSTSLDIKGDGVPMLVNSSNSNTFKIQFEDNGTVRGYIGCDNTNLLNLGNSSAASKFKVNTAGVTHNVDGSTHGSGVFMLSLIHI